MLIRPRRARVGSPCRACSTERSWRADPPRRKFGSEPIVCDTSPVSWQVFKAMKPIETVNRNLCDSLRFGQPQVDCDATPALFVSFQRSPICDAATCGAEMEADELATNIGLRRTRDMDAFAFEVISPQHAVAATDGAIAHRGRLGHPLEPPLNCAAVAGTLDHFSHRFDLLHPVWPAPEQMDCVDSCMAWNSHLPWSLARRALRLTRPASLAELLQTNLRCASAGRLVRTDFK